jgi:FkbM family methyltransferase
LDYESLVEKLYLRLLRPGDLVIDLGANVGRHSLPMADAVAPNGSVIAFEPIPDVFGQLNDRVRERGVERIVTTHRIALSSKPGDAVFYIAVDRPQESGLAKRTAYNGPTSIQETLVRVDTLDSYIDPTMRPVFIKIDVEGAELAALQGSAGVVSRSRPVVAFEFGMSSASAFDVEPAEMYSYWQAFDYTVMSIVGERLTREQFIESSTVQLVWDYVAIPSEKESDDLGAFLRRNAHRSSSRLWRAAGRARGLVSPTLKRT